LALVCAATAGEPRPLRLPTANGALFEPGAEERFFVGTEGKTWTTGTFGCVRSGGWQFHEGLDIRCLQRDKHGEPTDPIMAAADGTVAYINTRPFLSNYGDYIVLRHQIDDLEVYSLYAHLSAIQPGLKTGAPVKAGDPIGTMGRTSDTRQRISKDRAHVHFELDLLLNDRFAAWQKRNEPGEPNDHGEWNGHNLVGFDPRAVLLGQQEPKAHFNLAAFLRSQPELCRVFVRAATFPYLRRYPALVTRNPRAEKEGVIGYELVLTFDGLPVQLIPRAASEIKANARLQLLSVNEAEQKRNPACRLVRQRNGHWELTQGGQQRIDLLLY
jgi:murein DD-endopeptidase MepM/ murein hydrolase activator NlpD